MSLTYLCGKIFLKREVDPINFFLILISILFLQGHSGCQESPSHPTKFAPGELIVKFKPEAFDEDGNLISESIKSLNNKYGLISMEQIFKGPPSELAYIYKLNFPTEVDIMELVQEYQKDPSVIYAEPNYIVHTME